MRRKRPHNSHDRLFVSDSSGMVLFVITQDHRRLGGKRTVMARILVTSNCFQRSGLFWAG